MSNEETDYSKLQRQRDCKPDVEKLAALKSLSDDAPLSLQSACSELHRILPTK